MDITILDKWISTYKIAIQVFHIIIIMFPIIILTDLLNARIKGKTIRNFITEYRKRNRNYLVVIGICAFFLFVNYYPAPAIRDDAHIEKITYEISDLSTNKFVPSVIDNKETIKQIEELLKKQKYVRNIRRGTPYFREKIVFMDVFINGSNEKFLLAKGRMWKIEGKIFDSDNYIAFKIEDDYIDETNEIFSLLVENK